MIRYETTRFILITAMLVSAVGKADTTEPNSVVRIYLPREVTIEDDTAKLGKVGIVRGEESLAAKASEVLLGRISVAGQKLTVERSTVLSRLACSGVPASKVVLTGALKVIIKRNERIIRSGEFIELASSYLSKHRPGESVCQWEAISTPADLVVPGTNKDVEFSQRLCSGCERNRAKVQISVLADGQEVGVREVTFRLKYECQQAVTVTDIAAGEAVSSENVRIEKTISNHPESCGVPEDGISGLVAKRSLPANTVIRPSMIGPVETPIVLKRNQNVVIQVERPGLVITAIGKTLEQARAGEYIRVRNVDSQRIIWARVNEDGTVEPVF